MTAVSPVSEVDVLRARLTRVENALTDLREEVGELTDTGRDGVPGTDEAVCYANAREWVDQHFVTTFIRPLGGEWRWCAQWDEHAEARSRLEALWRTWEHYRTDPVTGIATWYREHLDHHLPILLGSRGPFAVCTPVRHEPASPLPTSPGTATTDPPTVPTVPTVPTARRT